MAKAWEEAFFSTPTPGTRKVALRSAMTLSPDPGGVFDVFLPTTRWMIEVGTFLLRTESELILKSRQVVPGRLVDAGFEFSYPTWPEAASELVARWRRTRG